MATTFSFDIVSEYDKAELNNVFDQTAREMAGRYDFKNTSAALEWLSADKTGVKVTGDHQFHIDSILDIFRKKLAIRGQSQKILDMSKEPVTTNMKMTLEVPFKHGLDQDKAKKITSLIRDAYPKTKTQIQGESVRVTSPKKDELQAVMNLVRSKEFDFPLNFNNFR